MAVAGESVQVPSRADALLRRLAGPRELVGGRYLPIDVLGQGGMGLVARARDTRLDRDVAIKWLLPELARDPSIVARFAAEATALARIHHPNVVQILDVGDPQDDSIYYVMELVPGESLVKRLRERGPLPWSLAFDVLLQTGSALAAVHAAGLVHRDVKPSNVLCTELGPEAMHVEVIDFGIARMVGAPRLTMPGEMIGTLPYMAPEQFAGLQGDPRTDVYGWGVLALELLGGVSPAKLFGVEALAGAPLRDAAPRLLDEARVQPRIAAIVRGCLAMQPEDRWADMGEVTQRLQALDDGGAPTLIYQRVGPERMGVTLVPGIGSDATLAAGTRLAEEIGATDEQPQTHIAGTGEQVAMHADAVTHVPRAGISIAAARPKATRWIAPVLATGLVAAAVAWGREAATPTPPPPPTDASNVETIPADANDVATPAMVAPLPARAPAREPAVVVAPASAVDDVATEVETIDTAIRAQARPPRSPSVRPRPRETPPSQAVPERPTQRPDAPSTSEPPPPPRPIEAIGEKPRRRDLKDPFR